MELSYCVPHGIPHSQFLRWSKDDRDKAIWWTVREKRRCSGCGTRPEEWDETQGGSRHAHKAELYRCRGCEVVESERDRHKDPERLGKGIHIRLVRRGG